MKIYVDCNAFRDGDGSECRPFKSITDAAKIALPGDEVLVAPGVYHEDVNPVHAGTPENRIVYRSVEPLGATITGAEDLTGWTPYEGDTWVVRVPNSVFGSYNPYTTRVIGDWYFAPTIRHTGSVYLNGQMLFETDTLEDTLKGGVDPLSWRPEISTLKWFTVQEDDVTVIYANFGGANPNEENVEFNVRRRCFFPEVTGIGYITFSGFHCTKAATTWAPPAAFQDGMVGPHWSKGWIIEDCELDNSRCCGISLGKYLDPENDMYFYTKHVKSPTQMERDAVCRGQYHGWLKEKVGSHIVRRCHIHDCGQTGIVGRMGAVFSIIEDNHIHDICTTQQLGGAETAGIKIHAAIDVTMRRNHIHDCIMGIWCDWQSQGARISQNLLYNNTVPEGISVGPGSMCSEDIFIEVGHGPTLIDNNVMLSKASLCIATEGVACVHNLMCGSFTLVGVGTDNTVNGKNQPRYTPYHIRHRTEVAGFMTILHGDDRFYNNIFLQRFPVEHPEFAADTNQHEFVGTFPFDSYPSLEEWLARFDFEHDPNMRELASVHFDHLPVWVDGNAYFAGAKGSRHEKVNFIDENSSVELKLEKTDEGMVLKTNLYDLLGDFHCALIDTETLGKAFEPEQKYENPDGTPITFDRDYFGAHRPIAPLPGPFAKADSVLKLTNA